MAMYQPFADFTAQSRTVSALMGMYAHLENQPNVRIELTPLVVFLAFSIESYLNFLGARKLSIWDELERLPWRAKVSILHKVAGRSSDWSHDPLQFATEVFKFRDRLAHGKPERVLGPKTRDHVEAHRIATREDLQSEWYRSLTREWVVDAKERFRVLMVYLGGLFGLHESDHLMTVTGGVLTDDEKDA